MEKTSRKKEREIERERERVRTSKQMVQTVQQFCELLAGEMF